MSFGGLPNVVVRVDAQIDRVKAALNTVGDRVKRLEGNTKLLNLDFRRLDRIWTLLAAGSGLALIRTFAKMTSTMQKTRLQIGVFERDITKVPAVMEKLITLADKVPFTLNTMATSFVRLKASGINPIIDDQGNGPLKNLADAVAAFGGGDEIFKRATIALQQMAGKGVISMEELRQQLGEAIPTAMRIMAREMDISVGELIQRVSQGKISFQEGFKALDEGFRKTFGGAGLLLVDTLEGQVLAFQKEFQRISNAFVGSGGADVITAGMKVLNAEIREFGNSITENITPDAINEFITSMENFVRTVDAALQPARELFSILGDILSTGASITSGVPSEIAGGGILGFLIFGRAGIVPGAIFGAFSEEVAKIVKGIKGLLDGSFAVLKKYGIEKGVGIEFAGIMGYLIFGKGGALAIMAAGIFTQFRPALDKFLGNLERTVLAKYAKLKGDIAGFFLGDDSLGGKAFFEEATKIEKKVLKEVGRVRFKEIFNKPAELVGVFGKELEAAIAKMEKLGSVSSTTGDAISKIFKQGREELELIGINRAEITGNFRPIQDLPGFSPDDLTNLTRLNKALGSMGTLAAGGGNAIDTLRAKVTSWVSELDAIMARTQAALVNMKDPMAKMAKDLGISVADLVALGESGAIDLSNMTPFDPAAAATLERMTLQIGDNKAAFLELMETIREFTDARLMTNIESQFARFSDVLKVFLVEGDPASTSLDIARAKLDAKFAGLQRQVDNFARTIENLSKDSPQRAEALLLLAAATELVGEAYDSGTASMIRNNEVLLEKSRIAREAAFSTLQLAAQELELEVAFDKVGLAALKMNKEFADMMKQFDKEILAIKQAQEGLVDEAWAAERIANIELVRERWIAAFTEMMERAKFQASSYGALMTDIANQLESSLASVFENLVTGAKSAKEILLDFYNSITAAVAKYLAQQALIGLFGLSGGSTGGLPQLFGNFFGGKPPGGNNATGGQFTVGGSGPTDSQRVVFNATPGEIVSIDTPGRSTNSDRVGGGGGNYTINITALDAASVKQLFLREGRSIIESLQGRKRLNRMSL